MTHAQISNWNLIFLLGVKGTDVAVLKVNRGFEEGMKVKTSITGITSLYSFSYERYITSFD
jgi:hypothetical protein